MRWWIGILIVIIVIIALILLNDYEPTPPPVAPTPTQAQTPEPEPTATQVAAQPRPPVRPAIDDILERIKQVAARNRVEIVGWQRTGGGANIKIQWIGDSSGPGGEFMHDLLLQGIIRSADNAQQGIFVNRQQQRVYWTQWQLNF